MSRDAQSLHSCRKRYGDGRDSINEGGRPCSASHEDVNARETTRLVHRDGLREVLCIVFALMLAHFREAHSLGTCLSIIPHKLYPGQRVAVCVSS